MIMEEPLVNKTDISGTSVVGLKINGILPLYRPFDERSIAVPSAVSRTKILEIAPYTHATNITDICSFKNYKHTCTTLLKD